MMEDAAVQTPRQAAGFLSLLTFSWMNNVLELGSKQPLEEKHLFPVEPVNQSEKLVGELEKEWLAEERASEQNNNNNNNNLIIYIALFTCADQKRFTVISLKTIKVYIIIHKQLKPKR